MVTASPDVPVTVLSDPERVGAVYVGSLFAFKFLPFDMHDETRD